MNSYGGKTFSDMVNKDLEFESSVNSYGGKTTLWESYEKLSLRVV